MLDLPEPELRTPQQHLAAMGKPLGQHLREADNLGDASAHQDIHVERNAGFEFAQLEQGFHEQPGIDRTRARFDHESDVTSRFVAYVGNERQLFRVDELSEFFHQPAFLHQLAGASRVDLVEVSTEGSHLDALVRFFQMRERRLRRR